MHVKRRIKMCLLIQKMSGQIAFCEKIGLINESTFHGEVICGEERK